MEGVLAEAASKMATSAAPMPGPNVAEVVDPELESTFRDAVDSMMDNELDMDVPEVSQRRMYGLFTRVVQGVATESCPPKMEVPQWEAHRETSSLSKSEAMTEYLSIVDALTLQSLQMEEGKPEKGGTVTAPKPMMKKNTLVGPEGVVHCTTAEGNEFDLALDLVSTVEGANSAPLLLHHLCRDGKGSDLGRVIRALPVECIRPDMPDSVDQLTPLMLAVDVESMECVKQMLAAGACLHPVDGECQTVFHYAAIVGNGDIAVELMTFGRQKWGADKMKEILAMTGSDGKTALDAARKCKNLEVVSALETVL